MSKIKVFFIIIALALITAGVILFVVSFKNGGLFKKAETKTYDNLAEFSNIDLDLSTSDVYIYKTDDKVKVECDDFEKLYHIVKVEDDTLKITMVDDYKWYEKFMQFRSGHNVKIYLPNEQYNKLKVENSTGDVLISKGLTFSEIDIKVSTGDVDANTKASGNITIKTNTGNISLNDIKANNLDLSVDTGKIKLWAIAVTGNITLTTSTGDVTLENVVGVDLTSKGSTGDIKLTKVMVSGKIDIKRSTGDVKFDMSDAKELKIKTSTGSVKGNLLSDKTFYAQSSTGSINVPHTTGDICEIETSTGKIEIEIYSEN